MLLTPFEYAAHCTLIMGDTSASDTLQLLGAKDTSSGARAIAATLAGLMKATEAVSALLGLRKTDDPAVRRAVMYALGELGNTQATPALIDALQDREPRLMDELKCEMVCAMGKGRPYITIWGGSLTSVNVAATAAVALGKLRDERAIPHLTRVMAEQCLASLRSAAAYAIGEIGERHALPLLANVRDAPEEDEDVRYWAGRAVAQIETSSKSLDAVSSQLRHKEPLMRYCAVNVLARRGDSRHVAELLRLRDDSHYVVVHPCPPTILCTIGRGAWEAAGRLAGKAGNVGPTKEGRLNAKRWR